MSRAVKHSVSVAIRKDGEPDRVLIVLRPPDDEELPDVWGLPAGTLRPGEDWEHAVGRVGREKLGVALNVGPELRRGATERRDYRLEMRLFEATIADGEPQAPQAAGGHTQYTHVRWGGAEDLRPAGRRGSLCCRLFLDDVNGVDFGTGNRD